MSELDPRARKIIEQALAADGPCEEERERVRSRLVARLGAAALAGGAAGAAGAASAAVTGGTAATAATASTPPAAGAAAAVGTAASTGSTAAVTAAGGAAALGAAGASLTTSAGTVASAGLAAKLALAVAVAGAIGVGAASTRWKQAGDPSDHNTSIPGPAPAERNIAGTLEQPAAEETEGRPTAEAESEAAIIDAVETAAEEPVAASPAQDIRNKDGRRDSLNRELELLRAAQKALQRGEPRRALAALDRHARLFPRGALRQEREAARAVSLCELGRLDEGREVARRVLARSPGTPLARRMASSCAFEPAPGGGR